MHLKKVTRENIQVFVIAFSILFFETAFFHILIFTHSYLEANFVISYALLGLSIGSLIIFFIGKKRIDFQLLIYLLIVSVALAFLNIVRFPEKVSFSPILVLPFLVANTAITLFFVRGNSNRVYFFDLAGATCGVLFSIVAIPLLKAENALLLCIFLLGVVSFFFNEGTLRKTRLLISLLLCLGSALVVLLNFYDGRFGLEAMTKCFDRSLPRVFCLLKNPQKSQRQYDLILSKDSLVSRISVYRKLQDGRSTVFVCYDSYSNDRITPGGPSVWSNDHRIPFMFSEKDSHKRLFVKDPKVLIVGSGAQGIVKPIKQLARDYTGIDAVEINPAIIDIMQNEFYEYSARAYEDLSVEVIDARTYLKRTSKRYDLVTLLNTYKTRNIGHFGEPDFLHTKDAMEEYFDHLEEDGFLLIEERDTNERSHASILRLLNSVASALEEKGAGKVEDHFFIYTWYSDKKKRKGSSFTMIVVKKTPMNQNDIGFFKTWLASHQKREYVSFASKAHTQAEYLPGEGLRTEFADFIKSKNREGFLGKRFVLTPTTDNNPYIFDVYREKTQVKGIIYKIGLICGGIFGVILIVLYRSLRKNGFLSAMPSVLFFASLGLGYFIIEIGLMGFYQNDMGSPTNSLIFILATLLLSSGIGSRFSRYYSGKQIAFSIVGIVAFSLYHLLINKQIVGILPFGSLAQNAFIALTIIPLGFFMGIPFPCGMEITKDRFNSKHISLFYAVNSMSAAFSIVLGLSLTVLMGFAQTFGIAIILYIIALLLFFRLSS
ncbi:MAG: hypothetical protein V2J25_16755 [Desulfatiglans sp.]|jgi:hypothetical protein|nr:hypothetical protein [Desulfatiglans sp.]